MVSHMQSSTMTQSFDLMNTIMDYDANHAATIGGHHMGLHMQTSILIRLVVVKAPYGVALANFATIIWGAPQGVAHANHRGSLSSRVEGTTGCCTCKPRLWW